MKFKDRIFEILKSAIAERSDIFIVDVNITKSNFIKVILDSDDSLSISDCHKISKQIINGLKDYDENFSLEVSSAGIGSPLVNKRQYKKNIGRFLEVKINSGEFYKGQLKSFNNDFIEINSKVREPKKKGKESVKVEKLKLIKLDEISKAKVVI
tara:strand:- start:30469 stop:30930 length:462 start_codon:yes stop_codon:yes gene_type:complete